MRKTCLCLAMLVLCVALGGCRERDYDEDNLLKDILDGFEEYEGSKDEETMRDDEVDKDDEGDKSKQESTSVSATMKNKEAHQIYEKFLVGEISAEISETIDPECGCAEQGTINEIIEACKRELGGAGIVQYGYMDAGADGLDELVLKIGNGDFNYYILRAVSKDKLEICRKSYTNGVTEAEIYSDGIIYEGGWYISRVVVIDRDGVAYTTHGADVYGLWDYDINIPGCEYRIVEIIGDDGYYVYDTPEEKEWAAKFNESGLWLEQPIISRDEFENKLEKRCKELNLPCYTLGYSGKALVEFVDLEN
ncbi:MAG: hypothetical protein IJW18_02780 [Lachnospiraceae bacterium]|nr:hypothetical protein [Lachnospiraceae bacterium]